MGLNIRPKTTVKLKAEANCPSHSLSEISVRDLVFTIDEPIERDGTNTGPTPTDTAVAALIGCTNVIGHKCAASLGINIGHLNISAVCDFDRRGVTLQEEVDVPFKKVILKIETGETVSQSDLDRLSAEVAKFCPLAKLFRQAGTVIDEEWISKSN
ncbi:MAG: OsmC family peroxiredoxin [Rhizobiaceae bacterium]|nr:OsmC family peroxiredoxin [Rhizobiaceae bacterium]